MDRSAELNKDGPLLYKYSYKQNMLSREIGLNQLRIDSKVNQGNNYSIMISS